MSISLIFFLYLYYAIIAVILVLAIFNIYHVVRFSFWDTPSLVATFLFLAAITIGLVVAGQHIGTVDWQQTLDFGQWIPTINPLDEGQLDRFIQQ